MKTHQFRESLQWGDSKKDEPFWDVVYRKAFPNLVNHMPTPGDVASQRMGIDRVLLLANGKNIHIDEKKRAKEYNDILLEYISVDTTGVLGWIEKDLAIDFLAYAFVSSGRCYLFSWPLLRLAWQQNRERWMQAYRPVIAQNRDYKTYSLPIPIGILQRSIARALVINVEPEERLTATRESARAENDNVDAALSRPAHIDEGRAQDIANFDPADDVLSPWGR